ncbi:protein of unknown function [Candidatus Promineifilum breve]|uniref:Uncharacterized protein n=1 Tax=Candidatus Promineifilum breve TaxID=1806508 RepID=A0A160T3I4_9CHLR|nr:protein of unknown function [Candidatus Promineifilum breve]
MGRNSPREYTGLKDMTHPWREPLVD